MSHIQAAIDSLLKIFPDGQACSHQHAREVFQALELAQAVEREREEKLDGWEEHGTELREALESMCYQYLRTEDGKLHHDFMSAGEEAFDALGWDDNGHPVDASCLCEVPGCGNCWTCGQNGADGKYHTTCDVHAKTVVPETEEQAEARWLADMRAAGCTEDMIAEAVAERRRMLASWQGKERPSLPK